MQRLKLGMQILLLLKKFSPQKVPNKQLHILKKLLLLLLKVSLKKVHKKLVPKKYKRNYYLLLSQVHMELYLFFKKLVTKKYKRNYYYQGSCTNHVDSKGGRGVDQMSTFVYVGGRGVGIMSMWSFFPIILRHNF